MRGDKLKGFLPKSLQFDQPSPPYNVYMYIYQVTENENTCSIQLLVSCLMQSSGIHFYMSIFYITKTVNENRD